MEGSDKIANSADKLGKYKTYIMVGCALGFIGYVIKHNESATATTSSTSDGTADAVPTADDQTAGALTDSLNTQIQQQISAMVEQTNTAFDQQKTYYDNLTTQLQTQATASASTITQLTALQHTDSTQISSDDAQLAVDATDNTELRNEVHNANVQIGKNDTTLKK
jgi:hypothetical protein